MAIKQIAHLPIKLRIAHLCANLSYATLILVLTLWAWSKGGLFPILWVIACVPLLILWPGMRKKRHRPYSWLCFVILFYFIKGVEGSLSSVAFWLDFTILALSVIIFISAMLTSRWLQYTRALSQTQPDNQPHTQQNTQEQAPEPPNEKDVS